MNQIRQVVARAIQCVGEGAREQQIFFSAAAPVVWCRVANELSRREDDNNNSLVTVPELSFELATSHSNRFILHLENVSAMEEFESLQQLYQRLVEVTQNELELSDDLLPYQSDVVDFIVEQITHMSKFISKNKSRLSPFCVEQHKIEVERFSYLINAYLRTRLKKIEANAPHLIKLLRTDIARATKFLSPLEAKYLDRYNDSIDSYMRNIIKDMPDNMQRFRLANMRQKEKLDYAFVVGCEEGAIIDGEAEIMLEPDVCRILTVSTIIDLLEKGSRQFKLI